MEQAGVQLLLGAKSLVVVGWLALMLGLERLKPATPWKQGADGFSQPRHVFHNLSFWGLNALLSPLLVLPVTLAAAAHAIPWRPADWPLWAMVPLDIILLDLWIYGWHRLNHEWPFLWRFHQVHHFDEQLDSTTALRFHFGEVLLSALARSPVILLLDIPFVSVIAFEILVLVGSIFHHSNISLPRRFESALSRVMITPAIHWVHHHARQRDTDSNYGTILSVWDRLFASRSRRRRSPDMTIGIEGRAENRLLPLLLMPFRSDRSVAGRL
jgi:sterol desaturase/sphingolipid hydroxylase (fatty acid hydroxylase superfamily)